MIDRKRFHAAMADIRGRLHNQDPEAIKAACVEWVEGEFAEFEDKVRRLRRGPEIFDPSLPYAEEADLAAFNVMSLGNWMEVASVAGIEAIPADYLGSLPVTGLLAMADPGDPEKAAANPVLMAIGQKVREILASVPDGHILRMDCAGGASLKGAMAKGHGDPMNEAPRARGFIERDGKRYLEADDPRLFEILMSYPEDMIPAWSRPWIEARRRPGINQWDEPGSFPCEWRVFIAGSEIVGISNYYPQSPLTVREVNPETIDKLCFLSLAMIAAMKAGKVRPFHPIYAREIPARDICCSLDFIEAADGRLLFLEGGPGHLTSFGAHPCCFKPLKTKGLALARGVPPAMQNLFPMEVAHMPGLQDLVAERVENHRKEMKRTPGFETG